MSHGFPSLLNNHISTGSFSQQEERDLDPCKADSEETPVLTKNDTCGPAFPNSRDFCPAAGSIVGPLLSCSNQGGLFKVKLVK